MSPKKHVLVAMSGGVDSSVAAALMLENGFDVTGIMLNLWSDPTCNTQNACCTPQAQFLAKTTANHLGIPFYVIDAKTIFHKEVVQYFIKSHKQGITPNPCWVCNVKVKWHILREQLGYFSADFVATGHYAKLIKDKRQKFHLYASIDKRKDQSYMLSGLTQNELSQTIFPLGDLNKSQVREKALHYGLDTAEKPESQDLCFLGTKSPEQFLAGLHIDDNREGDIVDIKGNILGHHKGLLSYTIGQRKGIKIAAREPYYVIRKEVDKNRLIVGHKAELGARKFIVSDLNWILEKEPEMPYQVQLQIRYHAKKIVAILNKCKDGNIEITSSDLLRDITPGQIAAFFKDDEVIGSGIIQ